MEDQKPGGYNLKLLRIDLSSKNIKIEKLDEDFCRRYLGGTGFIAHYLMKEVDPKTDPLGPKNKLIFAAGPITGIALPGSGRHAVGAKSPLSGGIAKCEAGEWWGSQFKRSGFDILIIEGKDKKPVYLWIKDGKAEIKDADHIWGKETKETQEIIRSELEDKKVRVAMIGPGGENLVRFACIMHGTANAAGRGGLGAVMGSKNLKAIAVRGNTAPPVKNTEGIREISSWMRDNLEPFKNLRTYGTGSATEKFEEVGNLPINNFRDSSFPNVGKITPQAIKEAIGVGMDACFGCPIRCKKVVESKEPYEVDRAYGGPEYETIGSIGSCCGIDDLYAIARGSALCNAYSIDTMSTGVTISFAMECYENGLLTKKDTGGIDLKFGNAEAMLEMIEKIAHREGIGKLLAEGSASAAEKIGKGAEKFAMQVKGVEIPMQEPRLSKGLGLGYMINPHGADHIDNLIDVVFSGFGSKPASIPGVSGQLGMEPTSLEDGGPKKTAYLKMFQSKSIISDCLAMCVFLPYSYNQIVQMVSSVTGWETSTMEMVRISDRVMTLCRLFNLRAGLTAEDDRLPERFFKPAADGGALKDKALDFDEMEAMKKYYYYIMGWDDNGVPKKEKLIELGIEE